MPDILGVYDVYDVYDVYAGNIDLTLREAVQLSINDPMLLVSAMAAVTQHLGFGVTVNPLSEHPYLLARRFSTLDHLTGGRFGWNIVTGYLDSAARAIGLGDLAIRCGYQRFGTTVMVAALLVLGPCAGAQADGALAQAIASPGRTPVCVTCSPVPGAA